MSVFDVYMIVRLLVRGLAVAFVPTTLIFITLWLNARARARAAERLLESRLTPPQPLPASAGRDERLDRLEQAVDSIAVEVERIAEGQRFAAKLLVERLGARDAIETPRPPRVVTPH